MIKSMTAFARVNVPQKQGGWAVEARSVNHRYLELSVKLPPAFTSLENRIRDMVQSFVTRGKMSLSLSRESRENGASNVRLNEEVVEFYFSTVRKLKKRYRLSGEISVSDILKLPGIFTAEHVEDNVEKEWAKFKPFIEKTLKQLVQAKQHEGQKLGKDITERLGKISKSVEKIEQKGLSEPARIYEKLNQKLDQLLSEREKDPERTHREVAFLVERADITEEVVRMKSHLNLFAVRLKHTAEVGRELDFLCQEMHREVNTMGSKSQLFEISTEVVFVKGEIEKIREQVQNIE